MRKHLLRLPPAALVVLLAQSAFAGTIGGTIANPDRCRGVQVLSREGRHPLRPKVASAMYDAGTGEFRAPDLPEGCYDLRLLIDDGVLEGVDMRVEIPEGADAGPLTAADRKAISEVVTRPVAAYMDINRPIMVRGNSLRACALVEVIRHRKVHAGKSGDLTWGVELWYFENWTNAWVRPPASRGRRKVLRRVRAPKDMSRASFEKMVCLFSPDLGGFEVGPGKSVEGVSATIPQPSASLGKSAGSVRKQIEEDRARNPDRFD